MLGGRIEKKENRVFSDPLSDHSHHPGFSSRGAESWQHRHRDSKSILGVRESGLSQSLQRDITTRRKKMAGGHRYCAVSVTRFESSLGTRSPTVRRRSSAVFHP